MRKRQICIPILFHELAFISKASLVLEYLAWYEGVPALWLEVVWNAQCQLVLSRRRSLGLKTSSGGESAEGMFLKLKSGKSAASPHPQGVFRGSKSMNSRSIAPRFELAEVSLFVATALPIGDLKNNRKS